MQIFYSIQPDVTWGIWITTNSLILPYYVCGMYKSNSNFDAGCPNWADWTDLIFGFVHSTDKIEQNKSVYHNQDTSTHIWWIGIENLFLKRHLLDNNAKICRLMKFFIKFIYFSGWFCSSGRRWRWFATSTRWRILNK